MSMTELEVHGNEVLIHPAGHHNLTWLYNGDKDFATSTSAVFDLYVGSPDFSITSPQGNSTTETVTAGQTAVYQLSLAPLSGFNGTVMFSCSGMPRGAVCSITPPSMTVSGNSVQPFTIGISTTANTVAAFVEPEGPPRWTPGLSCLLGSCVATLCLLPTRRRTRTQLRALSVLVIASVSLIASCGGSQTAVSPAENGTPSGTYTMVVMATAGAITHSQNLTLVIH